MLGREKDLNIIIVDCHPNHYHHYHLTQHDEHDVYQKRPLRDVTLRDGAFSEALVSLRNASGVSARASSGLNESTRKTLLAVLISATLLVTCCDARHVLSSQRLREQSRVERSLQPKTYTANNATSPHSTSSSNVQPALTVKSTDTSSISSSSIDIPTTRHPAPTPTDASEKSQLLSSLLSTLEKLQVLETASSTSCYRISRIIRRNIDDGPASDISNSRGLYGLEIVIETVALAENGANGKSSGNSQSLIAHVCSTDPSIELLNETTKNFGVGVNGVDGDQKDSKDANVAATTDPNNLRRDDSTNGLSRTQIVVISTCSTIIGIFFLVAAFLRIRNYIKRSRMEQALANRPKFRSCSVALRNPTQSMEQLRRDSTASKASRQNSVTTKGSNGSQTNGSSRENSSASSPRHEPDTAPLLIITRPADLSTSAGSSTSLQGIEETGQGSKKKTGVQATIVKNGCPEGCYIVALGQGQLSHVPMSIVQRADSLNGRSRQQLGMERGSSLKSRPNPKVSAERRTSLKIALPSTQDNGREPQVKSVKYNGQILRGKEGVLGSVKMNGEPPRIYQLVSSPDILQADRCKAIFIDPRRNGSWERSLGKAKGYQIVSSDDNEARCHEHPEVSDDVPPSNPCTSCAEVSDDFPASNPCTSCSGVTKQKKSSEISPESTKVETPDNNRRDQEKPVSNCAEADLDLISPLTESSYFGLSQSDVSLSSATNQGNEFFGQSEYHPEDSDSNTPDITSVVETPSNGPSATARGSELGNGQFVNKAYSPTSPMEQTLNCNYADFPAINKEPLSVKKHHAPVKVACENGEYNCEFNDEFNGKNLKDNSILALEQRRTTSSSNGHDSTSVKCSIDKSDAMLLDEL